jgi:hypothetical protein
MLRILHPIVWPVAERVSLAMALPRDMWHQDLPHSALHLAPQKGSGYSHLRWQWEIVQSPKKLVLRLMAGRLREALR